MTPRLSLSGISKRYGPVVASHNVELTIMPGEIHGVLGENGAGKSTLMKIIYGAVQPDAGSMSWNGQPVHLSSPRAARALGISMVFQHFSLFESLTVAENVLLGLPAGINKKQVSERLQTLASEYGLELDPNRPLHSLSVGERQRVEIARALMTEPRLLILDEPTSVLTPQAVEKLFVTLRRLAAEGCSLLYISHKLDEVRSLCQRCTVLRSGQVTGECDPREHDNASLARSMVGAEPQQLQRGDRTVNTADAPALEVRKQCLTSAADHGSVRVARAARRHARWCAPGGHRRVPARPLLCQRDPGQLDAGVRGGAAARLSDLRAVERSGRLQLPADHHLRRPGAAAAHDQWLSHPLRRAGGAGRGGADVPVRVPHLRRLPSAGGGPGAGGRTLRGFLRAS